MKTFREYLTEVYKSSAMSPKALISGKGKETLIGVIPYKLSNYSESYDLIKGTPAMGPTWKSMLFGLRHKSSGELHLAVHGTFYPKSKTFDVSTVIHHQGWKSRKDGGNAADLYQHLLDHGHVHRLVSDFSLSPGAADHIYKRLAANPTNHVTLGMVAPADHERTDLQVSREKELRPNWDDNFQPNELNDNNHYPDKYERFIVKKV